MFNIVTLQIAHKGKTIKSCTNQNLYLFTRRTLAMTESGKYPPELGLEYSVQDRSIQKVICVS